MKKEDIYKYIFSFLTCLSFSMLGMFPISSFMTFLVFILLLLVYYKIGNVEKLYKKILILSVFLSIIISTGYLISTNYYERYFTLFKIHNVLRIIICTIGLIPFFYYLFDYTCSLLRWVNCKYDKKLSIKKWLLYSSIIFGGWLPYLILNYPGIISPDVIYQFNQYLGMKTLTDHHPLLHTLFIGFFYKLFGSNNLAYACTVMVQMLILALIFGYLVYYLKTKGLNKTWTIIILVFFITPLFGMSAINLWKDTLFGGLILFLLLSLARLCDKVDKKNIGLFIISSMLCLLFRNNAIYMYAFLMGFTLIFFRKFIKKIGLSFMIVLVAYLVIKGPVFNHFNIAKSSSAEYLAIPIQQISRMVSKEVPMTKEEKKLIDDVIDINILKDAYNPYTSDKVKFNPNFKIQTYDEHKMNYLKLWLNLVVKHPTTAIESYLLSTLGYWYPDMDNYISYGYVAENNLGLYSDSLLPDTIATKLMSVANRKIPILDLEKSCSVGMVFILLSMLLCLYKKNKKYLICYIPIIGLWLSIMVATPVANEYRYVFWSYTCLPLLLFIPFKKENKND